MYGNISRLNNTAKLIADLAGVPGSGTFDQVTAHVRANNAIVPGNPAGLGGGNGFDVNIYEQLRDAALDVLYPDILWSQTIPMESVDTSINPGADLASYIVNDRRGKGAFRATMGQNIPTVGLSTGKVSIPIESGAIMSSIDIQDVRRIAFGFAGMNLLTRKGEVMREAAERHIEDVFFFGFSDLGFAGYLDYPYTPATTAGTKAAGGTTWAVATPDEILKDVNDNLGKVYSDTLQLFMPNRVELPVKQFVQISTMRINGTGGNGVNETVLSFLAKNNFYTVTTGQQLELRAIRYLKGAGAGGTDRMIVSDASARNMYMPMPVPFTLLAPQDRQYATDVFADYRFGSFHRPYPTSALYVDGI